jgi:lipopolysaccharide export LptBFGC system permease protein LptF
MPFKISLILKVRKIQQNSRHQIVILTLPSSPFDNYYNNDIYGCSLTTEGSTVFQLNNVYELILTDQITSNNHELRNLYGMKKDNNNNNKSEVTNIDVYRQILTGIIIEGSHHSSLSFNPTKQEKEDKNESEIESKLIKNENDNEYEARKIVHQNAKHSLWIQVHGLPTHFLHSNNELKSLPLGTDVHILIRKI